MNKRNSITLSLMIILTLALSACGGTAAPAADATSAAPAQDAAPVTSSNDGTPAPEQATPQPNDTRVIGSLAEDYDDALSVRNQLALGTLRLEGTPDAVTPEQASSLLPLWQALSTLSTSTTSAPEEMTALQNQIAESLTPAQLAAIDGMQLTNADLTGFYAEIGVAVSTPEPGITPEGTRGKDLTQEQREATRVASGGESGEPIGTGQGSDSGKSTILLDTLIELLTARGEA